MARIYPKLMTGDKGAEPAPSYWKSIAISYFKFFSMPLILAA